MGIISWIVFGLIAGILAKWIMPGKDGGGFILTIVLGIIGAVGRPENVLRSTHQADRVMAGGARLWARTSG